MPDEGRVFKDKLGTFDSTAFSITNKEVLNGTKTIAGVLAELTDAEKRGSY